MNDPLQQPEQAAVLAKKAALEKPVLALLKPDQSPAQAVAALVAAQQFAPAVKLLAWALGRREAVWWACECVQAELDADAPPEERAALDAAHKWAASPSEENRRAAHAEAEKTGYGTPAGQAAVAAFWSGGSLAPPKLAVVPPPEHLLPTAVANAVILAVVQREPLAVPAKFAKYIALAADVAAGKNRWKEEKPAPAAKPPVRR